MRFYEALKEAQEKGVRIARKNSNSWVWVGETTPTVLAADKFWNKHTRKFAEQDGGSAEVLPYLLTKTPDNIKPLLAKTELLPNCIVKQEFVKVEEINYGFGMYNFIREIGTTLEGKKVLFDYDYLLPDFTEPKTGFDYAKLERAFKDLKYI